MIRVETEFPSYVVSNADLGLEKEPRFVKLGKKLGINERRICSEEESGIDLAELACKKLLNADDKNQIDFLIYCTQSPEYPLPTTACVLQERIGLSKNCGALDFNLGCSGYIYGLAMAKSMLLTGLATKVLLVTAEVYSKHIKASDLSNRAIFGDAATASIIDLETAKLIKEFDLGTDGKGAENLIIKNGGEHSYFRKKSSDEDFLFMNGPEVFKFALESVPKTVNACLRKNNLKLVDVDYFIFHQANEYMLKSLMRVMDIPKDKFYINVAKVGNTVSNTIPVAIYDCLNRGEIKKGDCVLLCGFGVGYSWGSTIIYV